MSCSKICLQVKIVLRWSLFSQFTKEKNLQLTPTVFFTLPRY